MAHSHEHTKAVENRLSRVIGHLESIRSMVREDRDCTEILIQIAAVKSAVNNIGREILKEHIAHCIVDSARSGDEKAIGELNDALDRFMK
ncbi:MAG: metal-sensing transcriptional repressor [Clostridia bacterium]|nr:metal-sensing transcriptional repressor [Clostridia bacterium]MBQ4084979.1 metal-sensing transcriptional repressor [Clostridia bacterium]